MCLHQLDTVTNIEGNIAKYFWLNILHRLCWEDETVVEGKG